MFVFIDLSRGFQTRGFETRGFETRGFETRGVQAKGVQKILNSRDSAEYRRQGLVSLLASEARMPQVYLISRSPQQEETAS